jgi:Fe-S-cluster-containing dehydrogenase component
MPEGNYDMVKKTLNCPVIAYYKRDEDGVVVHQQAKYIGCGNCIRSCP